MTNSRSSRFPITVTQLPVVRCRICGRTLAHRAGDASVVLTAHYRRVHAAELGGPAELSE